MSALISRRALLAATAAATLAPGTRAQAQRAGATPLKIGFVHIGPVADGGWSQSHDEARAAVEREFGARVRTTTVESVPEGADAERVLRDLVAQGHGLIFGTSFGYGPSMLKVAADHPGVRFEHATGYRTAPNLRVFDSRDHEAGFLAGMVAAGTTKSRALGAVGSMPIPAVIRTINAFALGARTIDPSLVVKVVWTNEWFSPPKETEAAQALFNAGADVLLQTSDSPAVLKAAERASRHAFGLHTDMAAQAPKAHLGSIVVDWRPYYRKAVGEALDGRWQTGMAWWGLSEGTVDLVGVPATVAADTRARVDDTRQRLRARSFDMWQGPLVDSAGKPMRAAGQAGDDAFLRGMLMYVKGVEGKLPGQRGA